MRLTSMNMINITKNKEKGGSFYEKNTYAQVGGNW